MRTQREMQLAASAPLVAPAVARSRGAAELLEQAAGELATLARKVRAARAVSADTTSPDVLDAVIEEVEARGVATVRTAYVEIGRFVGPRSSRLEAALTTFVLARAQLRKELGCVRRRSFEALDLPGPRPLVPPRREDVPAAPAPLFSTALPVASGSLASARHRVAEPAPGSSSIPSLPVVVRACTAGAAVDGLDRITSGAIAEVLVFDASVRDRLSQAFMEPSASPPGHRVPAEILRWLRNIAIVVVALSVFEQFGTAALQHRAQARLRSELAASISRANVVATDAAARAVPGHAVARLEIARLRLDQVVVEGTDAGDLREGPGHVRGTPLPGEPGNAAIVGARTAYGGTFAHLGRLARGDVISVTTPQGAFRYTVEGRRTLNGAERGLVRDQGDNRITLMTSSSRYATGRLLVVWARVATGISPVAADVTPPRPPSHAPLRTGLDTGALAWSALWALLALVIALLAAPAARRWLPRSRSWLVTPLALVAVVPLAVSLSHVLAPTF